ncbi:MAG TPA: AlkA N-terminal domain-containing protein [Terriglobales bacterium]|nr:AlkA N-terminal domain-containing protein [Terriglobales bacterium]
MKLDWEVCSRARLARDARFDGKFFIAVVTTGIYCRPTCRARTSKECNIRYYPTAAAAAEAGFRPCLRCHPESSPGTPVWLGTQVTVRRALRLIEEAALENGSVESLAERLGIGSRHLRRLFLRHLGATPAAVAHTRRLHFAKKLIDETSLPMTQVAIASGFGCVRRFNAAIRKIYQRTPTQIRRLARRTDPLPEGQHIFHVSYRPPYSWEKILAFLAPRATPGVEQVTDGIYRRSISYNGCDGYFEVSHEPDKDGLAIRVQFPDPRSLFFIIERIRSMFDLNADWAAIAPTLRADPLLARLVNAQPGLRVPGCWNGFELAVRAILGQQVTVKGATALAARIARSLGTSIPNVGGLTRTFPTPQALASAELPTFMPRTRAQTIRALARAVCDGRISFEKVADSDALLSRLQEIPGIGRWTAQYIAMRALGDTDAFPYGDLGLLRSTNVKNARELEQRSDKWRPWRAYAAMYLWTFAPERTSPAIAEERVFGKAVSHSSPVVA